MKTSKPLLRALIAAGAIFSVSLPAAAADFTMKIGFATMNDIQHQWGTWMKEAIEARSKGRIEVKLFPRKDRKSVV